MFDLDNVVQAILKYRETAKNRKDVASDNGCMEMLRLVDAYQAGSAGIFISLH